MTHPIHPNAQDVINFWFNEGNEEYWFAKSDDFDAKINERFGDSLDAAKVGECADWRQTPQGALAEIIVLDQFSRNLYRDSPKAFAQDGMALILAQELLKRDDYHKLNDAQKRFGLMPYMHSESKKIHAQALQLFADLGDEMALEYEQRHKDIIDRFDRYPHRNDVLGRESTAEEIEFLKQPNSSF